jgi:cytoskeleton protein RodZ
MTIEGLGKKFQEARIARKLTLDEAARMTKIRPSRLAEIEADDFSQFPSLTYAKGFLQIYGKFLEVDVSPYMEAFEGSDAVTVDGYSYLQDNPAPKPARTPVVPRRPPPSMRSSGKPTSLMPLFIGIAVIFLGVMGMKLLLTLRRISPSRVEATATASPTPAFTIAPPPSPPSVQPAVAASSMASATVAPVAATATPALTTPAPTVVAVASPSATTAPPQPEVRRAQPVAPEDLAKATATAPEGSGPNKIAIRPLKKTYVKVVVDNDTSKAPYERWISPGDGPVEFHGQHFAIRVLDRDAVQIKKNGKSVTDDDSDVTIE